MMNNVSLPSSSEPIRVGFRKTSLLDYPARLASVIFFTGCNFRCPWCHNRELVLGEADDLLALNECLSIIEKRKHLVQGVVLTGGEPLLQGIISELIAQIHELGLLVKLDTNGSLPEKLATLIEDPRTRPDYVALDLKTDA
ncbi:MAG: anaerobic ribonucleoside-triphosphate reductase activating protein, partial [Spirochaetota bacterium]|nr:anaerobic ribonucleoside-triphosphate reductase activating protein [Spirochaetota bacterium]